MPIVLAIEPDLRQAAIIKRIVRDKIHADVVVVDSRDAALDAIRTSIPDVLLLSALLSPRDEDELIAHLRLLDGAEHLQTHTIPQLASTSADGDSGRGRGLLGMFSRKKEPDLAASGCDPDLFAEEIRTYLQHAHEKKEERKFLLEQGIDIDVRGPGSQPAKAAAAPVDDTTSDPEAGSAWSDPFAWRPSSSKAAKSPESRVPSPGSRVPSPESRVPSPESRVPSPESVVPSPESLVASQEPLVASPEPVVASHESVTLPPEPVFARHDSIVHSSEPAAEEYESVIRMPEPVVTPPAPVLGPEPILAAPAPADPWAVDYARQQAVVESESTMVGYTAPFSTTPLEPIKPTDSLGPAFEPVVDGPAITSSDETARVAQELDLRLDEDEEDANAPLVSELRLDADEPVHEISARDLLFEEDEPVAEPDDKAAPVVVAPAGTRRSRAASQSLLRLMPLAIWARAEIEKNGKRAAAVDAAEPRSVNDELRDLMSRLAVPPNVVGVSYARGCRIRRVRVPAGAEHQKDVRGPVILSKRALEERRSRTNA